MKSLVWLSLTNAWSKLSSAQKYQLMRQGFEKASNHGVDLKKYRLWKMNSMTKTFLDKSWAEEWIKLILDGDLQAQYGSYNVKVWLQNDQSTSKVPWLEVRKTIHIHPPIRRVGFLQKGTRNTGAYVSINDDYTIHSVVSKILSQILINERVLTGFVLFLERSSNWYDKKIRLISFWW